MSSLDEIVVMKTVEKTIYITHDQYCLTTHSYKNITFFLRWILNKDIANACKMCDVRNIKVIHIFVDLVIILKKLKKI